MTTMKPSGAPEKIHEAVVCTRDADGGVRIAPMGVRWRGPAAPGEAAQAVLMPFRPSATLDNLLRERRAVLNLLVEARVFAGCVTGRRDWPTCAVAGDGHGPWPPRLVCALRHVALEVLAVDQADGPRPVVRLAVVEDRGHAPFEGMNRAQAAVIEGAVLVSRLHLLPVERIAEEMAALQVAIDRTAGPAEREAWDWLREAVEERRRRPVARLASARGATA